MPDIRPVRIEPDLYETLTTMASVENRSITKQVNYLLRMQLSAVIQAAGEQSQASEREINRRLREGLN